MSGENQGNVSFELLKMQLRYHGASSFKRNGGSRVGDTSNYSRAETSERPEATAVSGLLKKGPSDLQLWT